MGILRGQGATEYLVLLAVVLIVALVSVALLGFFPGMAADARITQSQSYWRGEARPFAVLENTCQTGAAAASTCTLVIQNMEANGPYTITTTGINLGACTTNGTAFAFGAGETKTLSVGTCGAAATLAGTIYDLNLNITYTTPNQVTTKQYGAKNLVGRYL